MSGKCHAFVFFSINILSRDNGFHFGSLCAVLILRDMYDVEFSYFGIPAFVSCSQYTSQILLSTYRGPGMSNYIHIPGDMNRTQLIFHHEIMVFILGTFWAVLILRDTSSHILLTI